MPIADMQVRQQADRLVTLPEILRLRKGTEKTDKGYVGKDQKHFRAVYQPGFEGAQPIFEQLYSKEPTRFNGVKVMAESAATAFDYWYEEWSASTMLHRCDGVTQEVRYDTAKNSYEHDKATCVKGSCKCARVGRLSLFFPELVVRGFIGRVSALTSSFYDIQAISGYLASIEQAFAPTGLKIYNLEFDFWRAPRLVRAPIVDSATKKVTGRTVREYSLLHIKLSDEFSKQVAPLLVGGTALALDSGDHIEGALPAGATWANTEKWDSFIEWAAEAYKYSEALIFDALSNAIDQPVRAAADWTLTSVEAAAAVIAHANGYDAAKALAGKKFSQEYQDAVKALCKQKKAS